VALESQQLLLLELDDQQRQLAELRLVSVMLEPGS
jgi:hypothetical protein